MLTVTAQRGDHPVVARGKQLAVAGALDAVGADLDLPLGIPGGVVPDDEDEGQSVAHGGVELGHVKPERAVARHRHDRRRRQGEPRGDGERHRRTDRPGGTVRHPIRRV